MKKIFSIVLIGIFGILMTGCFGNSDNDSDNGNNTNNGSNNNGDSQNSGGNTETNVPVNPGELADNRYTRLLPKPFPATIIRQGTSGEDFYGIIFWDPNNSATEISVSAGKTYIEELKKMGWVEQKSCFEDWVGNPRFSIWFGKKDSWCFEFSYSGATIYSCSRYEEIYNLTMQSPTPCD